MAIEPVEIKDTILKNFTPSLDFAVQEHAGGVGSAGRTTGQQIVDYIGALNLSNLTNPADARANLTQDVPVRTISVAPEGSDLEGSGSCISPYQHILKAVEFAKANGVLTGKQYICEIFGGEISDGSGQIMIPPYFSFQGRTHASGIGNAQDIILDLAEWSTVPYGLIFIQDIYITGNLILDFSSLSGSTGFVSIKNLAVSGQLLIRGNPGFIQTVYLYNSFINNIFLDYVNLNTDSASFGYNPTESITNTTINYVDNAQTIFAAGTRTNFTPTSATVEGNFQGINTSLGLKADISSLDDVAFSGLYSDLTGTPVLSSLASSNTVVLRDGSGNFEANNITATLLGNANTATLAALAASVDTNGVNTAAIQNSAVTNAKLANMAANTIKANLTGGSAPPTDATIAQLQAALNTGAFAANQVLYGGPGGTILSSSNLIFNGSTLTINAGASGFNITGTNAAANIGANCQIGQSGSNGAFFANAVTGDICIRQLSSGLSLRIGVSINTAELNISDGLVALSCPLAFPQTQGGLSVPGSVITPIEYFENINTLETNTTGALVIASLNIKYQRIEKKVYMSFDRFSQNAVASSTIVFGVALPSKLRPPAITRCYVEGERAGARRTIEVQIDTTGVITIFGDDNGGNFQNGNIAAYFGSGFHYDI